MAAKSKLIYVCSNCGYETAKWAGKCPDCGEWNTLEETVKAPATAKTAAAAAIVSGGVHLNHPQAIHEIDTDDELRYHTGLSELDRVLGGGLV
ncbi:MAG: DNA repair protein RadA, partial [Clostridia bacterium]|nr:DNA repair protein RadA [Clostridia bacterium]